MDKLTQDQLREALELNYWSVDIALSYLVQIEPTDVEKHYFHTRRALTDITQGNLDCYTQQVNYHSKEAINKIDSRYRRLKVLWHDTDHETQPRGNSESSHAESTEYTVHYFIKWALSKDIEIPWLSWAIEEKLVPSELAESSIGNTKSAQVQNATSNEIFHKKERTYLLIIAALLHRQGIDWTHNGTNAKLRRYIEDIDNRLGKDSVGKVLKDLAGDEKITALIDALNKRIDPPN